MDIFHWTNKEHKVVICRVLHGKLMALCRATRKHDALSHRILLFFIASCHWAEMCGTNNFTPKMFISLLVVH